MIQSQYNINTNINLFKIVQAPPREQTNPRLVSEPTLNASHSQSLLPKPRVGTRRLVDAKSKVRPDEGIVVSIGTSS